MSTPASGASDISRTLRCPSCRREFSTARRFLVTCSECGHAWQEESILSTGERMSDAFGSALDKIVMPLMWLGVMFAFALFFAPLLYIVIYYTEASPGMIAALVVVLLMLGFMGFTFGGTSAYDSWVKHYRTAASRTRGHDDRP